LIVDVQLNRSLQPAGVTNRGQSKEKQWSEVRQEFMSSWL